MREISLDGYIDSDLFWGDEITPGCLKNLLYGEDGKLPVDDVTIKLNSYGGDCNAATMMYDIIQDYPGNVEIVISGTAASAATFLAQAATTLKMTPGSLFMIHDPMTVTFGNAKDHKDSLEVLKTVKESIINMYTKRCSLPREKIAALMSQTKWMDANEAKELGFIDEVAESKVRNAIVVPQDRALAEAKVKAWFDRRRPINKGSIVKDTSQTPSNTPVPDKVQADTRVKAADLEKRLLACKYDF